MITALIPIRTESTLNKREHWAVRAKRVKQERRAVWGALLGKLTLEKQPCNVYLTRIAPRKLDGDNLQGSLKGVRDQVADMLSMDDGDNRLKFEYAQRAGKPKEYAVEVRIERALA